MYVGAKNNIARTPFKKSQSLRVFQCKINGNKYDQMMAMMNRTPRLAKLAPSKYKTLEATIRHENIPIKTAHNLNAPSTKSISTAMLRINQKNRKIK